jgi:DNA-binding transcriptional LysR family regulator
MSHPGIVVDLITDNAFFTLTRRDADIALRPATSAPEGLVARNLGEVATAIYASENYARRRAGRGLVSLDWLAPDDSLSHLGSARWIAAQVAAERIVLRASSLTVLRAAARAGIGVAPLPCFVGDPDPALVRVAPPQPQMSAALWLLTHPDLRRTGRVRAVLDLFARSLARHRQLLAGGGELELSRPNGAAESLRSRRSAGSPPAACGSS